MGNKTQTSKKAEGISYEQLMSQAEAIVKNATPEKVMRVFNRTKNDNVKLDKFLSQSFTIPSAFSGTLADVAKQIDALINPANHEHYGLNNAEGQRVLLGVLRERFVSKAIEVKVNWLAGFNLSKEQEEKAALALEAYSKFMSNAVNNARKWEQVYGKINVTDDKSSVASEKGAEKIEKPTPVAAK